MIARVLGRKHDSVIDTIKNNRHQRGFKYGHFAARPYSTGHSHGYEFLITRKGLDALASVMRYNAKERIAKAYAAAWGSSVQSAVIPADKALPAPIQAQDPDEELTYTSEQQKYIDWLEGYNEELHDGFHKARSTMKLYSELYVTEKNRRKRAESKMSYWHDLYHDLLWRLHYGTDISLDDRLAAHKAFSERISVKTS